MSDLSLTDDALVIFEVLSRSNTKSDRAWRQRVYASVPNCQHYVTVATKSVAVERFDRSTGWTRVEFKGLDATVDLPALGVALPLSEVYRWTPLAA